MAPDILRQRALDLTAGTRRAALANWRSFTGIRRERNASSLWPRDVRLLAFVCRDRAERERRFRGEGLWAPLLGWPTRQEPGLRSEERRVGQECRSPGR